MTINPDRTVVFRYADSTAFSVKLFCDGELKKETKTILTEDYHSVRMTKDSDGIWTYTTPPMAPEVYTYQLERNGKRICDPTNPDSVRVHDERRSVFIIGGTPQTDMYLWDPLHGRLDTVEFQSSNEKKIRRIIVYTPPQYAESGQDYPVLYLLHGLNGNETAWMDRGRAAQVLDNLIVEHRAKPMIMVMPDANPVCLIAQKENIGLIKNIFLYPAWNDLEFEHCYPEMDAYLSGLYRFSQNQGSRAVAGLSAGAKQSANLANMYDSTFSSIGLFSPVVGGKQLPNNNYAYYWIGGGTADFFHHRINKFRKRMQRKHILYTMYNTKGGHTWRNWRVYFTEYAQTLFWNQR
ncbi:MAG: hypothetical protein J6X51_08325 [Bacteroidales bacterium]|nr:hypothetical protein [Bacteroidales bacterium]